MEYAADEDLLIFFLFDLNYTIDLLEEVYKYKLPEKPKYRKSLLINSGEQLKRKKAVKKFSRNWN